MFFVCAWWSSTSRSSRTKKITVLNRHTSVERFFLDLATRLPNKKIRLPVHNVRLIVFQTQTLSCPSSGPNMIYVYALMRRLAFANIKFAWNPRTVSHCLSDFHRHVTRSKCGQRLNDNHSNAIMCFPCSTCIQQSRVAPICRHIWCGGRRTGRCYLSSGRLS